jgi:hypothetical protein
MPGAAAGPPQYPLHTRSALAGRQGAAEAYILPRQHQVVTHVRLGTRRLVYGAFYPEPGLSEGPQAGRVIVSHDHEAKGPPGHPPVDLPHLIECLLADVVPLGEEKDLRIVASPQEQVPVALSHGPQGHPLSAERDLMGSEPHAPPPACPGPRSTYASTRPYARRDVSASSVRWPRHSCLACSQASGYECPQVHTGSQAPSGLCWSI